MYERVPDTEFYGIAKFFTRVFVDVTRGLHVKENSSFAMIQLALLSSRGNIMLFDLLYSFR